MHLDIARQLGTFDLVRVKIRIKDHYIAKLSENLDVESKEVKCKR